jgi:hypothetical protein
MRIVALITAFLALLAMAGGCARSATVTSVRDALLESARASYKDFPDGENTKLTRFAYLGSVKTAEGLIHVVDFSRVLTGMLAPRGYSAILFFDKNHKFLGFERLDAKPLWCRDGVVFLAGRTTQQAQRSGGKDNNGNAIDLSKGWENRALVDVCEYGSSGGIEHAVPTEEERAGERRNWDSK